MAKEGQKPQREESPDTAVRDHQDNELTEQQVNSEMAKAFQELARGERTASALESKLDDIEGRIEQLLASMEGRDITAGDEKGSAYYKSIKR